VLLAYLQAEVFVLGRFVLALVLLAGNVAGNDCINKAGLAKV
jgi:hypothetical protein